MSRALFKYNDKDLKRFQKAMKANPKKMKRVVAEMLNEFAFGNRTKSLEIIHKRMIVRDKRFVSRSIRVQKARGSQPVGQQQSRVGSIEQPRFSGWVEQELGRNSVRKRTTTILARGGDIQKKVRPSLRLRSKNQFVSPDDYPGKNDDHRTIIMLSDLKRKKSRKPFIIKRHSKFKPGLYKRYRGKIKQVQSFTPKSSRAKRVKWLSGGTKLFFRSADIHTMWGRKINRVFKFDKK